MPTARFVPLYFSLGFLSEAPVIMSTSAPISFVWLPCIVSVGVGVVAIKSGVADWLFLDFLLGVSSPASSTDALLFRFLLRAGVRATFQCARRKCLCSRCFM